MRLLANENLPGPVVTALQERGHDVVWVRTDHPGAADDEILRLAQAEGRLVVTCDKDFGEMAFRWGLPASCGVILLRLSMSSPEAAATRVVRILESRTDWSGAFTVVEEHRSRSRPLPATGKGRSLDG
jgi:predicted nuclease of predicted toxin-antitoxin system